MVVTVVGFVVVVLVGKMVWCVLTPLLSKWLGTGVTLLVQLTPKNDTGKRLTGGPSLVMK
jgi:hypothetical protein